MNVIPILRAFSAIALMLFLPGCDTLRGVSLELVSDAPPSPVASCVAEGVQRAGLELVPSSPNQASVREMGGKGPIFFVSYPDPAHISFYLYALHEPFSCKDLQSIVPHMRTAARLTQEACMARGNRGTVKEVWRQARCGL